jgi:hypothetical protein
MGLPGMVLSAISVTVGAVMYWAITYSGHGFRMGTVGIILMIVGAFGFVVSSIVFGVSRKSVGSNKRSLDRQVVDTQGNTSSLHEEVK